ncbi:AAA family ATPase [Streptomyces sp. NPDC059759]|uniref:AAA family ATPase n=1 Tax=Streptomyces sp. NPDC059759 TaxID=3346936 RepID=UPI003652AC8A
MGEHYTNQPPGHPVEGSAGTPPLLRLHLFGGFHVTRDGGPALAERWPRPSAQALVKLLAVAPGHSLHREQATEVCWPDADPHQALGSLRVALHAARRALEPELAPRRASSYLVSDGALLRLDAGTVWIDTDHAERLAEDALRTPTAPGLAAALDAFTGELLPEDRYADWAQVLRERLAGLRDRLRLALARAFLDDGAPEEAAATARQILDDHPAEERAHQLLMRASLRQGLRRQAIRQFHACRQALDGELGIRPGPVTERLHLQALDTDSPAGPATAAGQAFLPPAVLRGPVPAPLHGRGRALDDLVRPSGPPVRLIGGEAGLGKTRLALEAARQAFASGTAVLWGAGHDAEGHTPFGAFAEALDGWLAERPPAERARTGTEHPELASLLPSLGQVGAAAERSPEEERERLFRSTAAMLHDLAATAPVLVVLDDLHAADVGSWQLLSHLARRAAAAHADWRFLVTYRSEELAEFDPRLTVLDTLVRQRLAEHVGLERLTRADCLALAADTLGLPPGHEPPERVWELSLGNPLFALELASAPADTGAQTPHGVRQLVAERLARLGPAARRVVEAVAAAGGDAALSDVLDVAGGGLHPPLSPAEATAGADAAIAASVLAERDVVTDGQGGPGLAFRHPLIRLTCYERLSAARRRLLHSAYAETVLRRRPEAVDTLAVHLTLADDPRATGFLRRAAERAAALCANDAADHYYVQLTERLDSAAAEAAWIRIDRAAVLRRMARYDDAALILREALEDMRRRRDGDGRVLAAARLAEVLAKSRSATEGFAFLDASPPAPGTAADAAAAHHLGRSVLCFVTGRYPDAVEAARSAHEAAQRVTGPERRGLLARALTAQATALALAGRFSDARPVADEALPHAEAYGDPQVLASVLSVLREHARRSGRLREATRTGHRALELAERSGDPTAAAFERANLAELHLLLEEPGTAAALAEAAVDDDRRQGAVTWSTAYALAALARVRMRPGTGPDADTAPSAEELLARAADAANGQGDQQALHEVRLARAELLLRRRRPAAALELLTEPDAATTGAAPLTAWARLGTGDGLGAAELAARETARACEAGERLAEADARIAHAAALAALGHVTEAHQAFDTAESLSAALPYPAGGELVNRIRP